MSDHTDCRTILVTGAAGFLGSHTVDSLLADGLRVIGLDNFSTGRRCNLDSAAAHPNFKLHEMNLLNEGALASVMTESIDAIIHLAALVSVSAAEEDPMLNFRLNIAGTQLIAETARTYNVPRVVFASSAAVYGDQSTLPIQESIEPQPIGQYGTAKRVSEQILYQYARSYGLTTVCLRYFNIFGPRQDPSSPYSGVISIFTDRFRKGKGVTVFGDGKQTRDFVHVSDAARANRMMATEEAIKTGAYNVCTGQARSLLDLIDALQASYPNVPATTFEAPRAGDIAHSLGNPDKLRDATGFQAAMLFRKGIQALANA